MTVYLVGAGPGDPELLTLRGARLLATADVVVHDRLVSPQILELVAPWAELIDVGKTPGSKANSQSQINDVLVDRGRRFGCVVRLKGGDPYVFGRGAEEAAVLAEAGIESVVVPGISSAVSGPASAGIPVTLRNVAGSFTVVTAQRDPDGTDITDWPALAKLNSTLVVLMGVRQAQDIADDLIAGGLASSTPAAAIIDATLATETVNRGELHNLASLATRTPAVLIIGDVAAVDAAAFTPTIATHAMSTLHLNTSPSPHTMEATE